MIRNSYILLYMNFMLRWIQYDREACDNLIGKKAAALEYYIFCKGTVVKT